MKEINTHYKKGGFATSDDVVLSTDKTTRLVFVPGVHGAGVRGQLVRQKMSAGGGWVTVNEVNFNSLPADCGVKIDLSTEATKLLFDELGVLYKLSEHGVSYGQDGEQKYIVADPTEVLIVDDHAKRQAISELLTQGHSQELWDELVAADPDLATRLAAGQLQVARQKVISEFASSLYAKSTEEDYWQQLFADNPWILQSASSASVYLLGSDTYLGGKMPIGRSGKGGVATDFLMSDASTKSFAVTEIKTPAAGLVGGQYRGDKAQAGLDNETYSMHADLTGALVQTRNQITVTIENFDAVVGKAFSDINRIHPKGILIIGSLEGLGERQRASFNQFRHGQYSLTIVTFDELLKRLAITYEVNLEDLVSDE